MRTPLVIAASSLLAFACTKHDKPVQQQTPPPAAPAPAKPAPAPAGLDTAAIEKLTGVKGKLDAKSGVFKVSLPRKDLQVTIADHIKMTPAMGLTAWAAFQKMGDHTMVMGDMVLTEDQVNGAMSAALDNGLEVTAL